MNNPISQTPLNALRAFESAARHGSFADAAIDIGVTPAAISQQIRGLEERIGRKLFYRVNRGVMLTVAGQEVMPKLSAGLDMLAAVTEHLRDSAVAARLTVSTPTSFTIGWLAKRISSFVSSEPNLEVCLRAENDPVSFVRDKVDVRVSYGRYYYAEHSGEDLITDKVYPLCSPGFLEKHGSITTVNQMLNAPLIHIDWGASDARYPRWSEWFESAGLAVGDTAGHGHSANSSRVALEMAEAGTGLVLGQRLLAADSIASGDLVCPLDIGLELQSPYCLIVPTGRIERPYVREFVSWLRENILVSTSGTL